MTAVASPVAVAARGKGLAPLARRALAIAGGYGPSPLRMQQRLATVLELLEPYGCPVTLPITASALARNPGAVAWHASRGIEFALHGYRHVDHTALPAAEQLAQLRAACRVLSRRGFDVTGFRAPYLRSNGHTLAAVRASGLAYDSSQALAWPVGAALATPAYRRLLAFCDPLPAATHPVLPRLADGLVLIPYCLPDDEAVVDRLGLDAAAIAELWCGVQRATHARGELLTLGVHPERVTACRAGVEAVLRAAAAARPRVWMARLADVAAWWRARVGARVKAHGDGPGRLLVRVDGPPGVTVLARDLAVDAPSEPWADGYRRVHARAFVAHARQRPFVGVNPSSDPALARFLGEQGYVVEAAAAPGAHACHLRRTRFTRADERAVLAELEGGRFPLLRLGRWPDGARSAFCLTGDVDALTVWDYALRFLGR